MYTIYSTLTLDDNSVITLQPTKKPNLASFKVVKSGTEYKKGMKGVKIVNGKWKSSKFNRKFNIISISP